MRTEADPALFARWAIGWTITRGVPAPAAVPGGWRVDSVRADHRWRFLYPGVADAIAERARTPLSEPFHVKVAAAAERVRPLLPAGWSIDDTTCMMTRTAAAPAMPVLPADYRISRSAPLPGVIRTEIVDANGELAASGQLALVDDMAVFDQIRTNDAHRRRGLGRAVMTILGRAANEAGATLWMLAATAEGAALYTTLGWDRHSPYLTAVPPA